MVLSGSNCHWENYFRISQKLWGGLYWPLMRGVSWRTANKIFLQKQKFSNNSQETFWLNFQPVWNNILQRTFVHLYLRNFSAITHEVEYKTEVCCDSLAGAKISLEGIHFIFQNQQFLICCVHIYPWWARFPVFTPVYNLYFISDEWQTKRSLAKDPENNHSFIKFFCCCKFPEIYCQAKQHGFMFNAWI